MKYLILFLVILLIACQTNEQADKRTSKITYNTAKTRKGQIPVTNPDIDSLIEFEPSPFISYENYPARDLYVGSKAKLDNNSHPLAKQFKTRIKTTYEQQGLNFAGHYCFVYWDCGSGCKMSIIIDLKTGKVFPGPTSSTGYEFRKDSKRITINPPYADYFNNGDNAGYYRADCEWCIPEIWVWDEEKRHFVQEDSSPLKLDNCIDPKPTH